MNWDELEKYIDPLGYVTLNDQAVDGPGAGNLLLHTGLYYVSAYQAEHIPKKQFSEVVKHSEVKTGLYWRSPYKIGDRQEHDDYLGISAAAYFYAPQIAKDIVKHGEDHAWCYNSQNPDKFEVTLLHDRFPGQVDFYKMCAHENISIWSQLILVIRALLLSFASQDDSHIQAYLILTVGKYANPFLFYPAWWISPLRKSPGKSFEKYLGTGHPLSRIEK